MHNSYREIAYQSQPSLNFCMNGGASVPDSEAYLTPEIVAAFSDAGKEVGATHLSSFRDYILDTLSHQKSVALLSYQMALCLDLSSKARSILFCAAFLHDSGKFACNLDTLYLAGRYSPRQREQIQEHPNYSHAILLKKDVPFYNGVIERANLEEKLSLTPFDPNDSTIVPSIAEVAKYHHEHVDGSGYPNGLKGCEIPLAAKVITVADVFDALCRPRCYKRGMEEEEAINTMQEMSGKALDSSLLDVLLLVKKYPSLGCTSVHGSSCVMTPRPA